MTDLGSVAGARAPIAPPRERSAERGDAYGVIYDIAPDRAPSSDVRGGLDQLIENEILPRLMLAHRTRVAAHAHARPAPDPTQIDALCTHLLDPSAVDLDAEINGLIGPDHGVADALRDVLGPAARRLGALWEDDKWDFVDVTVAIGRLQAYAHDVCARLERDGTPSAGRHILLLPCPGETHTFALPVVASIFREAGWGVTTGAFGANLDACAELARMEWFDAIGVSVSCEVLVPELARAVPVLRKASCNRNVKILVGGPILRDRPDLACRIGADAVAGDGWHAPALAESLLEKPARAC